MSPRAFLPLLLFLASYSANAYTIRSDKKFLPRHTATPYELSLQNLSDPDQALECSVRQLAYQYALNIQPFRGTQQATYDSLAIDTYCNNSNSTTSTSTTQSASVYHINSPIHMDARTYTVYVDPIHGNDYSNNGSESSPFQSLYRALTATRAQKSNELNKQIVIRSGILFMNTTVTLSPTTYDSNLLIRAYPNENVTISGGVLLNSTKLQWVRYNDGNASHNIWMTKIDPSALYNRTIYSLFTLSPHSRLTRARYPNGHVEVYQNNEYFLNPYWVDTWWTLPANLSNAPQQIFQNLYNCNTTQPCLNYSSNLPFDTYTIGYGGLCDLWNHPGCRMSDCYSYWCGENCHGGWANEDQRMSLLGYRQLPIGMTYNQSLLPEFASMSFDDESVLHVRHSQGWNVFMFKLSMDQTNTAAGNISLGAGGWQGGRVWTRTHDLNQNAVTNLPIMAGEMYLDNIFSELDTEGEWYYDADNLRLYYWPNNTKIGDPPPADIDLVIGNLSCLFELVSDDYKNPLFNVSIQDINFRDTRYTYMERWATPSGGDWALYRGGAIFVENATNCSIAGNYFSRLDGNVIMLSGYTRNITVYRNEFEWIGDNVIAGWGFTLPDGDGTNGLQPRFSYIVENYVHDIGLYQLQSSLWFQARSCQNHLIRNIGFNLPRAAILFNDAFGGGNEVYQNLLFNTCTESGDHGPINSWNRIPFLTSLVHGYPSYDVLYTNVHSNFIFANYGGSQAFDTDDGSAWYSMYDNFFYDALGYKNDYGGYNVNYHGNLNVVWNWVNGQSCWGVGKVNMNGPANNITNNTCIVYGCRHPECEDIVAWLMYPNVVQESPMTLQENVYYTVHGNATWQIQNKNGSWSYWNLTQIQSVGLEEKSMFGGLPSNEAIINQAKRILNMT